MWGFVLYRLRQIMGSQARTFNLLPTRHAACMSGSALIYVVEIGMVLGHHI